MFLKYLSQENPTTVFVIYHDQKNFDERKKVVKTIRKNTQFIDVEKMDYHQLYKVTAQAIKSRHCGDRRRCFRTFLSYAQ